MTTTSATGNGTIFLTGLTTPTDRGIILYPYTDTDKIIGGANVTNVHEAGTFGTGTFTASLPSLTVNTRYNARAHSTDASNGTTYGSRVDFWTLANVPDAPTVSTPTATTLNVAVNVHANPDSTQFAIFDTVTDQYVQANGSLGADTMWHTAATWGAKTVTGLTAGNEYTFKVQARNGSRVETAFGATTSGTPLDLPLLTTNAVSDITTLSANGNGYITDIGVDNPTNRGIIRYPYTNTDKIIGGTNVVNVNETGTYDTGTYFVSLPGLAVNTRYNARAHASNTDGTGYGARVDFWTLANAPNTPTVNNPTTTSLDLAIDTNNNPSITKFAILETSGNKYVQANGTLGNDSVWQTKAQWHVNAANTVKTITGLSENTQYVFQVKAKNGFNVETVFSSEDSLYTLAKVPFKPTVGNPSENTMDITINANGNPAITQFAIQDSAGGKYVQSNGSLGNNAAWQTKAAWETDASNTAKTATELGVNAFYAFRVKARNGDNTETAFTYATSLYTLANIPSPPHVFNPTASTLDISIDPNENPAHTLFCVQDSVNNNFVQTNGTRSGTVAWQTAASWDTTTVTSLNVGGTYYFRAKAKNGNDVQTAYSLTTAGTTCLNPTTGGVIGNAQTICYNTSPAALTETTAPTGYAGTLEYQWQSSSTDDTVSFGNINGATASGYTPGQLTDTTWYRRLVKVTCKAEWIRSNILKISVYPDFTTGSIETTGDTICYGGDPVMIENQALATGGDGNISYQWQSSVAGPITGYGNISGATSSSYDPPTGLTDTTWFRRMAKDGDCNTTLTASSGIWKVTVYPQFTVGSISTAQTICEGSAPMELTGIAPSGGNTPFSYQWQTSSNNATFTDISGATTLNLEPGTLTQTTWYRLQQSSASGCGTLTTDTVAITVNPTTVGGLVSGDTLVCYGSHTSVLTLSGQTGSVLKWQYSTNNVLWVDLTGHTATTYTAENLITNTRYRAVVQSGVCLVEHSSSHLIKVFTNYKISGYAKYENNPKSKLNGLKITLKRGDTIVGTPYITSTTGYYEFQNLVNGTYKLDIKSAHPTGNWQTWGGVNNTDYLLALRHATTGPLLSENPPVVRVSGDVKSPKTPPVITTVDAEAIRYAAKYGWGTPKPWFDIPKWVFSGLNADTRIDSIVMTCGNLTRDIRGLCAGDVNGSYLPPNGYKVAEPSLELVNRGTMPITPEIIFPIRAERDMELGALTLMLDYDTTLFEITGVDMPDNGGEAPYFVLRRSSLVLEIGWMSLNPVNVATGQTVLLINTKVKKYERRTTNDEVRLQFTLNASPLSELADGDGNVLYDARLSVADAGFKVQGSRLEGEAGVVVYPNPAKEVLNVEYFLEKQTPVQIELLNMQGIFILKLPQIRQIQIPGWGRERLDISGVLSGVYMLKVTIGDQVEVRKVIVNR
jgi:hypothetical protein